MSSLPGSLLEFVFQIIFPILVLATTFPVSGILIVTGCNAQASIDSQKEEALVLYTIESKVEDLSQTVEAR